MDEQTTGPDQPVEVQPTTQTFQPHRGTVILVLGILGIVCCFICGIIAWVMGNNDLRDMDAGIKDPSGRGLTQAGKICGIVSVVLQIIGIIIWLLFVALGVATGPMQTGAY